MPTFVAVHSSAVHNGKPEIRVIDDEGGHHYLRFDPGMVPVFALALLDKTRGTNPTGQTQRTEQHLELLSVEPLAFPNGEVGLRLGTDAGLEIPLHLTPQSIGDLKKSLADIEGLIAHRGDGDTAH